MVVENKPGAVMTIGVAEVLKQPADGHTLLSVSAPIAAVPGLVPNAPFNLEADFAPHMLYVTNQDKPGFIGRFGATLAGAGINIATFHLGRANQGGDAICLVSVDDEVPEDVLSMVRTLPLVMQATSLAF